MHWQGAITPNDFVCPSQVCIFIFCKIKDLLLAISYISYLPEVSIQLVASWKLGIHIAYYICVFFRGVHSESIFLIRKKIKKIFHNKVHRAMFRVLNI